MLISNHTVLHEFPSCFRIPPSCAEHPPFPACTSSAPQRPSKLLFGQDPDLLAGILSSIRSEAMNRHLKVSGVFNPFLPDRLDALSVEGIGNFTLDLNELTVAGGLIDCSPALSEANEETMATIQELRWARSALTKEITRIGKLLADTRFLLIVQGSRLIDSSAIRAKAERIARKLPKVAHGIGKCAIQSYGETERINYLPFGKEVRIFSLPNKYNLAALFLNALADALADRGCHGILLTAVFTGEIVGIYLPHNGVCYLTDAPDGLREKELALSRFLLPFTAEQRRGYRRLSASADAIEWHLCERISEYRALVSREEELLSRFHNESRLQNFRKRLLIDLFCSKL